MWGLAGGGAEAQLRVGVLRFPIPSIDFNCKSGIFVVKKYFHSQWQLRKIILRKRTYTISINAVCGRSYGNFSP